MLESRFRIPGGGPFALLLGGFGISLVGDGVFLLVATKMLVASSGPQALGLMLALIGISRSVSLIAATAVLDRWRHTTVLIVSDVVRLVACVALIVLLARGVRVDLCFLAVAVPLGVGSALYQPSLSAVIPALVPPAEILRATSIMELIRPLGAMSAGPLAGAVLLNEGNAYLAIAFDCLTFVVSLACIWAIAVSGEQPRGSGGGEVEPRQAGGLSTAVRYAFRTPWLGVALVFGLIANMVFNGVVQTIVPGRILELSESEPQGTRHIAMFMAVAGVAVACGSFAAVRLYPKRRQFEWMLGCFLGWAVLACLIVHLTSLLGLVLFAGISYFLGGTGGVWKETQILTRSDRSVLGRVLALDWLMATALLPLAFYVGGWSSSRFGAVTASTVFLVVGLVCLAPLLLVVLSRSKDETVWNDVEVAAALRRG